MNADSYGPPLDQPEPDEFAGRPNPYDRGEVLEPHVWRIDDILATNEDRYGRVDFDDDEAITQLTIRVLIKDGKPTVEITRQDAEEIDVVII